MKWLPALSAVLFSFAAMAADEQAQPALKPMPYSPKPGIVIIDGKKFFPLQNAKRFTSTGYSPSAMRVMNHPHPQGVIVTRGTQSTLPPAPVPATGDSTAKAEPADVLSIFAPEDKGASPSAPIDAPIK